MAASSNNTTTPLRIGILGCANIARKNAIAILDPASGCAVTAVASRSIEKARNFVHEMLPNKAEDTVDCWGSYDELLQSEKIDAVYVPLPTRLHKEWVLKALQSGKHVLVEKPVAMCVEDYQDMIATAREHNKYLMDGTMFVHHPRTDQFVRSVQNAATFGTLKRIEAGFSFCGDAAFFETNIRASSGGDPLGCLGDLGWYILRMALLVVGPHATLVNAQVVDVQQTTEGVPIDATCLVKFDNPPVVLNFQCSFTSQFRQYVHVIGTRAWASMDDFVLPKAHPVHFKIHSMELTEFDLLTQHTCHQEDFHQGPVQEVLMWQRFSSLAKAVDADGGWEGTPAVEELSGVSVRNQEVLDALIKSIVDQQPTLP